MIDAHVHLYPPAVNSDPTGWAAARGESLWAAFCTRRRKDGRAVQGFPSVEQLLADMDAAGVARAVLLGWYWEHHETCVDQNAFYASCIQAHPSRFSAFATVHPAAGDAVLDEVRRAKDAGFIGLGELSPHSQGVRMDDRVWREIMTLAGELGLPVNLHVTDASSKPFPGRVHTPLTDFIALARDFPQTKFILAHWGGGLAWAVEAVELTNVWYDTAASPLLYGSEVWKKGASGRVLFGSDYPLVLFPKAAAGHSFTGIIEEAKVAGAAPEIFRVNAQVLLGLG